MLTLSLWSSNPDRNEEKRLRSVGLKPRRKASRLPSTHSGRTDMNGRTRLRKRNPPPLMMGSREVVADEEVVRLLTSPVDDDLVATWRIDDDEKIGSFSSSKLSMQRLHDAGWHRRGFETQSKAEPIHFKALPSLRSYPSPSSTHLFKMEADM